MVVIEASDDGLEKARRDGAEVFVGNAADPEILASANLAAARQLFVTIPEPKASFGTPAQRMSRLSV